MTDSGKLNIRLPLTKDSTREEVVAAFEGTADLSELEGVFEGDMPDWIEEEYPGIHDYMPADN